MELSCILVLALVALVTATPSGYGVKGGARAVAKAEVATGAGAFGGVALPIPSGAGYSGSFAKSSSSSFAASSASSSSSSFSFSGSGTTGADVNGIPAAGTNGVVTEGCNGNCKSGNNKITDATGAGSTNQNFNRAKAAAGAGDIAISGPPYGKNYYPEPCSSGDCTNQKTSECSGSSCGDNGDSEKCTSGKCGTTPQANDSKEKCVVGQCSPSLYNSDDIQVNIASAASKTSQNSIDQTVKYNSSDYASSQSAPSSPNKPPTYLTAPKEDSPCMSHDCALPSSPFGDVYDTEKPSSYNVPILGPNYEPSTQNKGPCSTGKCKNDQPGNSGTNLSSGPTRSGSICASGSCQNYPNNQINPGSQSVPSGYKPISPPIVPTVGPSTGAENPTFGQPSAASDSAFVNSGTVTGAHALGNYGTPKLTTASNTKKLPPYKGGFGGPAGILKPNDFSVANKIHVSSFKPITPTVPNVSGAAICTSGNCASRPTKPAANIPICGSGNCGPKAPVFINDVPSAEPSSEASPCTSGRCGISSNSPILSNLTTSTENFKAGILRPYEEKPTPVQEGYNLPSFQHVQSNEPSTVQYRPGKPSICSSGNCPASPGPKPNHHSSSEPSFPTKLTGTFGGPAGILKPNDYSKPLVHISEPSLTQGSFSPSKFPSDQQVQTNEPSTDQYIPAGNPYNCSSGNCGSQAPSSGSYNPSVQSKPNTPQIPSIGFGGPAGVLNPNDFRIPSTSNYKLIPAAVGIINPPDISSPQYDQFHVSNTPQYKPAGPSAPTTCSSGNCAYQPLEPQVGSAVTTQTYPILCTSANCGPKPSQTSTVPAVTYNSAYCSSGNCETTTRLPTVPSEQQNPSSPGLKQPVISGSFYSTFQSSPSSSNYGPSNSQSQTYSPTGAAATGSFNPSCSSGKCSPKQLPAQLHSGDTKPASSTNIYNPQPCTSENCGLSNKIPNTHTSAGAFSPATCTPGKCGVNSLPGYSSPHHNQPGPLNFAVGAVASAGAVAYTGGFGGPPGLLKPYDGRKLSTTLASFGPKRPVEAVPHGSGSYGISINDAGSSLSGESSQASAVAGAAAGAYGGVGYLGGYNEQESGHKRDCISGCVSRGGSNFGHNGGLDGFGALSAAGASAKSVASAIGGGGTGTHGQAGSFASSSATAHASAGLLTKGYDRR